MSPLFTPANLSNLGLRIRAQANSSSSDKRAYVDCAKVTVYYEENMGSCGSCGDVTEVDATSDPNYCENIYMDFHNSDPNCCGTTSGYNCQVIHVTLHEDADIAKLDFGGNLNDARLFDKDCNLLATGDMHEVMVDVQGQENYVTLCKAGRP
ncbi:MAG: hypothetical protein IPL49_05035 [Saprospirales bacterium]|nr:hypothetical protein [Saprospirales bacterium]